MYLKQYHSIGVPRRMNHDIRCSIGVHVRSEQLDVAYGGVGERMDGKRRTACHSVRRKQDRFVIGRIPCGNQQGVTTASGRVRCYNLKGSSYRLDKGEGTDLLSFS